MQYGTGSVATNYHAEGIHRQRTREIIHCSVTNPLWVPQAQHPHAIKPDDPLEIGQYEGEKNNEEKNNVVDVNRSIAGSKAV